MVDRIKAAADAKQNDDFVIMARTDALAVEGIDAAIERAIACAESGADAIFPEAILEIEQYQQFANALTSRYLANITEFGKTPLFNCETLGKAGVAMVLYPLSAFRAMSKAAEEVYQAIATNGDQMSVVPACRPEQLYEVLGYHDYEQKLDKLFEN